ncbi:MAG: response regulator [Elusimicrobia bacterium]|nr:response regulator [Elusimicrobiota bacterium]
MATEILIVDDDPIGGGLTNTLLKEAGYVTQLITDSKKAIETIKAERPGLVILDILMPGIDGLTLCHRIKEDPSIRDTKIIMVSGKSFQAEKQRAMRYGANLFIEKPYNIDTFSQQVMEVVGPPQAPAAPPQGVRAEAALQVRVWGSRAQGGGSGLPTPCVSVETPTQLFILDAGTGILSLGEELLREGNRKQAWILLTHFHPAHLEGLGRFAPTRDPAFELRIGGPSDPDKSLSDAVREALESSYEALPQPVAAKIQLYELQEGHYDLLPEFKLSTFYSNHPSTTLGYVLDTEGRRVLYSPDCELYGEAANAMQDYDEKLGMLCQGADLLIQDARWTDADYRAHRNEGHSSVASALDFAVRHEVGEILLFHQDASYSDEQLDAMEREARQEVKSRGSSLSCRVARPGLKLEF